MFTLLFSLLQRFGAVLEALEKGQPVDLSAMPPAPEGQCGNCRVSSQAGLGKIIRSGPPDTLPTRLLWASRPEDLVTSC